jgi:hypothetical protein
LAAEKPRLGCDAATFPALRGFPGVNTFLKVLLVILVTLLVLKLLPVVLGLGVGLVVMLSLAAVFGVGVAGILICVVLALALFLSPVWLPVLVIVGVVALCKKTGKTT